MKGPVTLKMAGPEVFQTLIGEEFVSKRVFDIWFNPLVIIIL